MKGRPIPSSLLPSAIARLKANVVCGRGSRRRVSTRSAPPTRLARRLPHRYYFTSMPPNPPQTPLRRLSQGSLFRLSRSGAYPDAPHGLGFLEPALAELIDEAEALQTNVEGLRNLDNALATFNESFASYLYVMNMNALTTDWPQVRLDLYRALPRTEVGTPR